MQSLGPLARTAVTQLLRGVSAAASHRTMPVWPLPWRESSRTLRGFSSAASPEVQSMTLESVAPGLPATFQLAPPPRPKTTKLVIDGQIVDALDEKTTPNIDPRTGAPFCEVASAGPEDINKAVRAARLAFDCGPWPYLSGRERGRILFHFAELLDKHVEELAKLECIDTGKPLAIARAGDVRLTADHFRYFAGWADKLEGKTIPVDGDFFAYTLREPIGVVAAITPWNFPLLMMSWKVAPALAAGNTIVCKPAERTPLTAIRAAELALEAGIPPGVFNVCPGSGKTAGTALAAHPGVDKISFMGTTNVGTMVSTAAAPTVKRVALELGGKSPAIVCHDVDVDHAVQETHRALFFNAGQACTAGSRLFVHEAVYDEFVEKATRRAEQVRLGDPFDPNTDQGPMANAAQLKTVMHFVEKGIEEGATLLTGGKHVGAPGFWHDPTIFAHVTDDMTIARSEIFGPVMSILKYSDYGEIAKRANNTDYGLAAGIWTQDINRAHELARAIHAGSVWINTYHQYDAALPFGGFKRSGIGRDKGEYAIDLYTELKVITMPLKTWSHAKRPDASGSPPPPRS